MVPKHKHGMLMNMTDEWEVDIAMWINSSQLPQDMKGMNKYECVMNERYIVEKYSGFMIWMSFN